MSSNRIPLFVSGFAAILLLVCLGWWWLVFGKIATAGTIGPLDVVTCLVADTDLCRLAEALCMNDHLIDIRWYAPEMFWAAAATGIAAAIQHYRQAPGV